MIDEKYRGVTEHSLLAKIVGSDKYADILPRLGIDSSTRHGFLTGLGIEAEDAARIIAAYTLAERMGEEAAYYAKIQ